MREELETWQLVERSIMKKYRKQDAANKAGGFPAAHEKTAKVPRVGQNVGQAKTGDSAKHANQT